MLWSIYIFIYHIYIWYSWWMMESIEEYSYRRRLLVDQLAGDLGWSWSPTSCALRSRQGQNRMCFHFRYLSSNLTWRNGDITQVSLNKRQKVRIAHGPAFVAYGLYYTSIMHTIYLEKSNGAKRHCHRGQLRPRGYWLYTCRSFQILKQLVVGKTPCCWYLTCSTSWGELFGYSRMLEKDLTCSSHVHPKLDLNFRETSRSTWQRKWWWVQEETLWWISIVNLV